MSTQEALQEQNVGESIMVSKKKVLIVSSLNMAKDGVEGGIRSYISMFAENRTDCSIDLLTVSNGPVKEVKNINKVYSIKVGGKPVCVFFYLKVIAMIITHKWKFGSYDAVIHNRYEDRLASLFIECKSKIVLIHGSGKYAFLFWPKIVAIVYFILEGFALPTFDRIYVLLANKDFGVPYYRKRFKRIANRINYAPVPIADYFLNIPPIKSENFNNNKLTIKIIYFGRVNNKPKNVLLFPDYVVCLRKNADVTFTIAGDGDDVNELKKVIKEKGVEENFTFLGSCKHESLPGIIRGHNLTMLLSSFEGICLTTLESIAAGIPVAAYPVGDIPAYVRDMENGVLLDVQSSVEENCDKIVKFMSSFNGEMLDSGNILDKYTIQNAVNVIRIETV